MKKITEQAIGKLLLIGVLTSAAIVFVGGIFYLIENGNKLYVHPQLGSHALHHFGARSIILLGVATLILVQFLRVGLTVLLFASKRDLVFTGISSIVLLMLVLSIIGI